MSVVLMYHALYRGSDTSDIDQEDLPYAVSEANFIAQLDRLTGRRVGLLEADNTPPEIILTFDDGHRSNLEIAAPLLQERKLSAYFFVTTDFIDRRPGFMSTAQLQELAAMPGMCIGSHGVSHRFFDDLSESDSKRELLSSREYINSLTDRECRSISFPGGRYNDQTLQQLAGAGYVQWFGSEVGTLSLADWASDQPMESNLALSSTQHDTAGNLQPQRQLAPLPRVAVRRTTQNDEFALMIEADAGYYRRHLVRRQAKNLIRRLLGNRLYHGLYKSLSAR